MITLSLDPHPGSHTVVAMEVFAECIVVDLAGKAIGLFQPIIWAGIVDAVIGHVHGWGPFMARR